MTRRPRRLRATPGMLGVCINGNGDATDSQVVFATAKTYLTNSPPSGQLLDYFSWIIKKQEFRQSTTGGEFSRGRGAPVLFSHLLVNNSLDGGHRGENLGL